MFSKQNEINEVRLRVQHHLPAKEKREFSISVITIDFFSSFHFFSISFHDREIWLPKRGINMKRMTETEGTFNLSTNKILNVINGIDHDIGWLVWFSMPFFSLLYSLTSFHLQSFCHDIYIQW